MAAIEVAEPAEFNLNRFAAFLSEQPDLGTKWVPRFVRAVRAVPTTGAGKVDKSVLRLEAWSVDDPVWWRPDRESAYRRFTARDADDLRAAFAASGREDVHPGARSSS
jgi:fatty-acyl-CoA synthase